MPFCPQCSREFGTGVLNCPDCHAALLRTRPLDPNQMEMFEMVEIYKIPDEITGMALSSFLADAGVQASIQPMEASFYGGALNVMLGYWGKLLVEREDEAKARKFLEDFLRDFHTR